MTDQDDADTRDDEKVAAHLLEHRGEIGTVWQPGDGSQYILGLSRITTGSYATDHVLTVVVSGEAFTCYLPAPWYPDPEIVIRWPSTREGLEKLIPLVRARLKAEQTFGEVPA